MIFFLSLIYRVQKKWHCFNTYLHFSLQNFLQRRNKKAEKAKSKPLATSTPKTRKGKEEHRKTWRETKAAQRAKWTSQKARRHRERSLQYHYDQKGGSYLIYICILLVWSTIQCQRKIMHTFSCPAGCMNTEDLFQIYSWVNSCQRWDWEDTPVTRKLSSSWVDKTQIHWNHISICFRTNNLAVLWNCTGYQESWVVGRKNQ